MSLQTKLARSLHSCLYRRIWGIFLGAGVPQRWIFAVMGCLAITNAYMMRVCLSLAITQMVANVEILKNVTSVDETCSATTESTSSSSSSGGTFEWSEYTQGIILSSFFWGYAISHVPGGLLADKYGGKYTLGLGVFSTAIFSLLTPLVVNTYDATGLIILRVLIGLGEGITYPAVSVLISKWAPPLERTKIGTFVISGMPLGTVVGNSLSGVLIRYSPIGWPIVFYVFGSLGVLWFLIWIPLCHESPDVHPFISEKEKNYLHERMNDHTRSKKQPIPWRYILTSIPMWALLVAKLGNAWGGHTMLTDLPKYMSNVVKIPIMVNGFVTALPYVLMWFVGNMSSWVADSAIRTDKVSRTNVRKMLNSISSYIPAAFVIAASYAGCNQTIVVILFTVGIGMTGMNNASTMINPNDLSPNYAGTLMAVGNGIAALAGIAAPYAVGVLTPHRTLSEWRIVFWISAVIYCLSALIFSIWGDGEIQDWNDLAAKVHRKTEIESGRPANKHRSPIERPNKL